MPRLSGHVERRPPLLVQAQREGVPQLARAIGGRRRQAKPALFGHAPSRGVPGAALQPRRAAAAAAAAGSDVASFAGGSRGGGNDCQAYDGLVVRVGLGNDPEAGDGALGGGLVRGRPALLARHHQRPRIDRGDRGEGLLALPPARHREAGGRQAVVVALRQDPPVRPLHQVRQAMGPPMARGNHRRDVAVRPVAAREVGPDDRQGVE